MVAYYVSRIVPNIKDGPRKKALLLSSETEQDGETIIYLFLEDINFMIRENKQFKKIVRAVTNVPPMENIKWS